MYKADASKCRLAHASCATTYTRTKTKSFSLFWKYTLTTNEPILNSVCFWVTLICLFQVLCRMNEKFCLWVCFLFCNCKWRGYKCRCVTLNPDAEQPMKSCLKRNLHLSHSNKLRHTPAIRICTNQEEMESFAFPDMFKIKINLISTEIKQKCSKL